jgi:IrrE N-terminal-like domain
MALTYQYPIKRSPKKDPQQYQVYRMENEAIGARRYMSMDRPTIRQLVRSVCRNYRVPVVKVRWKNLGKWAAMWNDENDIGGEAIVLNTRKRTAQDVMTITHELAHHIHHHLSDKKATSLGQQDHGPQFMACHMSILDTCRVIPVVGMKAICDRWKVKYIDPGPGNSLFVLKRICRGRNSPTA